MTGFQIHELLWCCFESLRRLGFEGRDIFVVFGKTNAAVTVGDPRNAALLIEVPCDGDFAQEEHAKFLEFAKLANIGPGPNNPNQELLGPIWNRFKERTGGTAIVVIAANLRAGANIKGRRKSARALERASRKIALDLQGNLVVRPPSADLTIH